MGRRCDVEYEPEARTGQAAGIGRTNGNGPGADAYDNEGCSDRPDADEQPPPPDYVTAAALVGGNPHLRPTIIEGVLRAGKTMDVIASSKAGKSWLVGSLGIAVAAGLPWLGRFAVQRGRQAPNFDWNARK